MIDYLLAFTNEAAAIADPVLGPYHIAAGSGPGAVAHWRGDCVIPIVVSWNPANDTTQVVSVPGGGTASVTVHSYASGWWCLFTVPARIPALDSDNNMAVVLDRDAAIAGQLPAQYIKAFNPTLFPSVTALINTCRFQPSYAGSNYAALQP